MIAMMGPRQDLRVRIPASARAAHFPLERALP